MTPPTQNCRVLLPQQDTALDDQKSTMNDDESGDAQCPSWAVSLGYLGVASAVCLSNWGSAVSFIEEKSLFDSPGFARAPLSGLKKDLRSCNRYFT
jgi:hypothetical protein